MSRFLLVVNTRGLLHNKQYSVPVAVSLNGIQNVLVKVREMLHGSMPTILTFPVHHSIVQALAVTILNERRNVQATEVCEVDSVCETSRKIWRHSNFKSLPTIPFVCKNNAP